MDRLNANLTPAPARPVKVLQFGEGNFLRAFADWMIDIANEKTDFNGSIVLVKPINLGSLFPAFREQDYRYTVMLRGLVDGQPVESVDGLTAAVRAADADHMEVVVLRDGAEKTLIFTGLYNAEKGVNFMDTTIANGRKKVSVGFAVRESVAYCWEMAGLVFKSLGMLFTREASIQDMAGPVGIVQLLGQAAESGWYTVLNLCTLLSVNLGVFNLFPIPALDGGRLLFILIEWLRGKPVPPEKEGLVHLIGLGLLLILVVVVTFNDVLRLIRG